MARFSLEVTHAPARVPGRDAKSVGARVWRDDAYFQYVEVLVTGIEQTLVYGDESKSERFWPATLACLLDVLPDLASDPAVPLDPPSQAWPYVPDPNRVREHIKSPRSLPPLVEGEVWSYRELPG